MFLVYSEECGTKSKRRDQTGMHQVVTTTKVINNEKFLNPSQKVVVVMRGDFSREVNPVKK